MKVRSLFRKPMVLTGALTLAALGYKAFFNQFPGADENFFSWTGPTQEFEDERYGRWTLPVRYYRDDAFVGIFSADYEALRAALPSLDLYPVRLGADRANFVVGAFNYHEADPGPYGEVLIGTFCTFGREARPVLPLLLESHYPGLGLFVLHLPVTSRPARDGGRKLYGFTKFMADMDFEKRPDAQGVRVEEGGQHILSLTVKQRGMVFRDNRPSVTYSVLDRDLIRTTMPCRSIYQLDLRPGAGRLELGSHPIADELREFDIRTTALLTRAYLTRALILPPGEPVGTVSREHPGHVGRDVEFGRLTIRYDDLRAPVDVYARAHAGAEAPEPA